MYDFLPYALTATVWVIAASMSAWALVGFVPHLWRPERRAAWWFALAIVLLLSKAFFRSLWWDGLGIFMGEQDAIDFRDQAGGTDINFIFDIISIIAAYAILRLLWLLIPEEERVYYRPWSAPFYPKKPNLSGLIERMRETFRGPR